MYTVELAEVASTPKGQTMNASRYISVLNDHLLNFMSIHGCTTFQQDSAPCHKVKSVMNWFQTKNVRVLKWPGNSPDLNPIENHIALFKGTATMHNVSCACNNVLCLVAASLFTIFISTCTLINFKLIVSKNENKKIKK